MADDDDWDEEEDEEEARPKKKSKKKSKSKKPFPVVPVAVGVAVLVVLGIAAIFVVPMLTGSKKKPTAENDPPPPGQQQPTTPQPDAAEAKRAQIAEQVRSYADLERAELERIRATALPVLLEGLKDRKTSLTFTSTATETTVSGIVTKQEKRTWNVLVHRVSVGILGVMGPTARDAVPALRKMLPEAKDAEERRELWIALVRIQPLDTRTIADALKVNDRAVSDEVGFELSNLLVPAKLDFDNPKPSPNQQAVNNLLVALVKDSDAAVRKAALGLVSQLLLMPGTDATQSLQFGASVLRTGLQDTDANVRLAALEATYSASQKLLPLGYTLDEVFAPLLIADVARLLQDKEVVIKRSAATLFGHLVWRTMVGGNGPAAVLKAVPALEAATKDADAGVRQAATQSLQWVRAGRFGKPPG